MRKQLRSKYGILILFVFLLASAIITKSFASQQNLTSTTNPLTGEITRTISPDTEVVGSVFKLTYTFDLEQVLTQISGPNLNSYELIQWQAELVEVIPEGFDVLFPLPEEATYDANTRELKASLDFECGKKNSGAAITCNNETTNKKPSIVIELLGHTPGDYSFGEGKFEYNFYADHAGQGAGSVKHDRTYEGNPGLLGTNIATVKGLVLELPESLTLYMNELDSIEAKLSSTIPDNVSIDWEVADDNILQLTKETDTSMELKAIGIGETEVRATYTYPNGFTVRSNALRVTTKLPMLSFVPEPDELWVYKNSDGDMINQTADVALEQSKVDGVLLLDRLGVSWKSGSSALSVVSTGLHTATIQAQHGSAQSVQITGALTDYIDQSKSVLIRVNEYPQLVSTPNVILYMSDSPYAYPVSFWPETANVTGYGLTVLEGMDVLQVDGDKLILSKPGLAKVGLVTEDVSASFPEGEGPEPISQTFYVQVKDGTDPNPGTENPTGDFY